ncbi:uncharacterized protein LOC125488916 [Plutella xylostella]|uniref:uncharacterized protein LOC125488916 n=1 Tax=Plutella xylostella TaxID=51655 RepID=UPI00203238C0|nr:uncharacterized protein LOC125488916 [Plutella xylostella]
MDHGMRGPYKVTRALPSGRYELRLLASSYGKTTQAAAQYMVPWKGEWCPETCAAFFEQGDLSEDTTTPAHQDPEPVAGPSRPASETREAPAQHLPDISDAVEDDA